MRLGLLLGVLAFLVAGGIMNAILGNANDAMNYALFAGILAFAGGMDLERKGNESTDNPAPTEYALPLPAAYSLLRNTVAAYHHGGSFFFIRLDAPGSRQLVAALSFSEPRSLLSSEQLARQIVLTARLTPSASGVALSLRWEVYAQLNRDSCTEVIRDLSTAIDQALRSASAGAYN